MNRILRHFNCDLTDFILDWTLLQNRTQGKLPGWGGALEEGVALTSPGRKLALPSVVPLDAEFTAYSSRADQQLVLATWQQPGLTTWHIR